MGVSYATAQDVADRWRPLTSDETSVAAVLAADASAVIRARFPGIDGQVDSGAVDPDILKMVVAGMVKRALISPAEGVSQQSETAGPYSHSQTFANPMRNVYLTEADLVLILGYIPTGSSHNFANDTTDCSASYGYVYGW
ncbi:MAG: hypothetical protein HOV83_03920 [Catenulispora sp.]|nr:hypothetical protein [Catenulispora sp.]